MSEQKIERKVVGRTVAIALGIVCIILAASLVGVIVNYTSIISDREKTISSQNSQVANLQSQVSDLNNTLNLSKSKILYRETIPFYGYSWHFSTSNAGYISVNVQSSSGKYVQVSYVAYGVEYYNSITVGTNGTAIFPVLPAEIGVGVNNTNLSNETTATVTITYYY
jgi:hypothetical protein